MPLKEYLPNRLAVLDSILSGFPFGTSPPSVTRAILASAGLKPSDFQGVPTTNYVKGGNMMAAGKIDMALVAPGSGASRKQHSDLRNHGGLRFLSIGANLAAMREVFPEAYPMTVKSTKSLPGLVNDTTLMAYPFYILTGTHVPADVIYKVIKVIHENQADLSKAFAAFRAMDVKDMAHPHKTLKFHPGAVRYYKEVGIWQNGRM